MFGIKVNGVFLDVKPGTTGEVERKSPFFAMQEFAAENSTPISFKWTEKNALVLGFLYNYYSQRQKTKVSAELYDGNTFKCICTLIIETGTMNINRIEDSELSGFIVFGISEFFQLVKDKKLNDLTLGGLRSFNYTTNNPDDGSAGYWQHFHNTWVDDTIPYVFAPVRDDSYYTEAGDADWMNKLDNNGKLLYEFKTNPLVPMIRVKYLIEQIFIEHGFTVDFLLDDTEWEKLLLLNLTKVFWVAPGPVAGTGGGYTIVDMPAPNINIDLKRHVPQNKYISDFILQIFSRYAWAPVFSISQRKVRIVAAKRLGKGLKRKDWTAYASPLVTSSFNTDEKIFAFTNEIDNNDEFPSAPEFTNAKFYLPAFTIQHVPEPDPNNDGRLIYCYLENQWYQANLDETTNTYKWMVYGDNIYNEETDKSTDTINTTVSTLPVYRTKYRTSGGNDYYGMFPLLKQEAAKEIGYRTLIYHGMVWETRDNGGIGQIKYPYASSIRVDPLGTTSLTWSNVYRHKLYGGTIYEADYGLIQYWWRDFLSILQAGEDDDFRVNLPFHELLQFEWDDEIIIANVPYLVQKILDPFPYTGYIQATMKRIGKPLPPVVIVAGGGTGGGGGATTGVFARLSVFNIVSTNILGPILRHCDVKISLYSDSAGTIAYTPPVLLPVSVRSTKKVNGVVVSSVQDYHGILFSEQVIMVNVEYNFQNATTGAMISETIYSLDPSGANNYVVI